MAARPDLPALFPDAAGAQALEPDLLAMNFKALLQALNNRNGQSHQAAYYSASFAREVRMTLAFGALVGQFEMPCPFMHKRLMYQAGPAEAFERAINRDLVGDGPPEAGGNLVLAQWFAGLQQNVQNCCSGAGPPKVRGVEQIFNI